MSLGVLNNINAIYATNNLNKTSSSLSTVLQQLSSGSKINSGADDAAGLSLVNGLAANATALTQSKTNATEGVGLLTVADGALSQVTTLLNRAVTLATEASNGTLNTSQTAAANQEYQSILSEIDNIGSTTTYNQQKVFGGADVTVYTGDSSTQSASVDSLHFATVASDSVGDSGGTMQYSSGQGVFIDLQLSATGIVAGTDTLTAGTLTFTSWDTAAATTVDTTIVTSAAETVNQLITAINSAGLGVSASLTTSAHATGDTVAATKSDLGISITGLVSAGTAPTSATSLTEVTSTLKDSTAVGTVAAAVTSGSGSAMISYLAGTDGSSDLTTYDLTTQAGAQATLTALNTAIADVAAQDGYIGAQINTLNSVSSVLSTQTTNVTAAQDAVQATDYATATSNMSKYEILSQTGISALAQANSIQKEVTKLLQ